MRRRRLLHALRRLHLWIGLLSAFYFFLIALTGVALNHRQGLRLEERYVSRSWLSQSYRPDDGREVRADIVIGDLHSGLIFGKIGGPILDVVATVWLLSLITGLSMVAVGRSLHSGERVVVPVIQPAQPPVSPQRPEPLPSDQEPLYTRALTRR